MIIFLNSVYSIEPENCIVIITSDTELSGNLNIYFSYSNRSENSRMLPVLSTKLIINRIDGWDFEALFTSPISEKNKNKNNIYYNVYFVNAKSVACTILKVTIKTARVGTYSGSGNDEYPQAPIIHLHTNNVIKNVLYIIYS